MDKIIFDEDIIQILTLYALEVKQEKIQFIILNASYESEGMQDRLIILRAIG